MALGITIERSLLVSTLRVHQFFLARWAFLYGLVFLCVSVSSIASDRYSPSERILINYASAPSCTELSRSNRGDELSISINGDPSILQNNFTGGCSLISILNSSPRSDLVIDIGSNHPAEVVFWVNTDKQLIVDKDTLVTERPFGYRYFASKLPIIEGEHELNILVRQRGVFNVPIFVHTEKEFERADRINFLIGGIFIGALIIAVLASIVLVFVSGQAVFLGYLGLVIASSLMVLAKTGLGQAILWVSHPAFTDAAISLSVPMAVISVLFILWAGLDALRLSPVMFRSLILISLVAIFNYLFGAISSLNSLENSIQIVLLGPFVLFLFSVLFFCAKKYRDESLNLAFAIFFLVGGVSISTLSNIGLIGDWLWALRAAELGASLSATAGVFLALLRLRNDREKANILAEELTRLRDSRERELTDEISKKTSWLASLSAERERLLEEFFSFSRFLAHDVRNPLANIANQTLLMQKKYSHDEPVQKITKSIQKSVTRISAMFGDWLVAQRLSLKYHKLEISEFSVGDLLEEVLSETDWSADIDFKNFLGENPHLVNWDKVLIKRVFHNLLDNIKKHGWSKNGAELHICHDSNPDFIKIFVRDFGSKNFFDIVKRQVNKTVQSIAQIDELEANEKGLGLSFVQKVIVKHGGTVAFESTVDDHGLTVILRMPLNTRTDD